MGGEGRASFANDLEAPLLRRWLAPFSDGQVLSLACGTGRFLNLATHGLDASEKMAAVARQKLPGKTIHVGRAEVVDRLGIRPDVNGRVLLRRSG